MRRIPRWQFWLGMAVIAAVPRLVYANIERGWAPADAIPGAFALILSVFGPLVLARWRFNDLGYDPDDAIVVVVPIANLWVYYRCLFLGTPSEAARSLRIEKWKRHYGPEGIGAVEAVRRGFRVWTRALPLFLPLALANGLLYAGANALVERALNWAKSGDQALVESVIPFLSASVAFLLLFLAAQAWRRNDVSRSSWTPGLFVLPLALSALALWLRSSRDLGMAVVSLPYEAMDLLWSAFVGGTLAIVWITVADRLDNGDSLTQAWTAGRREIGRRGGDVIAVHGGSQTAIFVGMQVVLPGIHYLITYAFTDFAALLHPERRSFAWSTDLARGIRARLFITQFLAFLLYLVPVLSITLASTGLDANALISGFMDPTTVPWHMHAIGGTLWMLSVALIKASLLQLYRDRATLLMQTESNEAASAARASAPVDASNPFAAPPEPVVSEDWNVARTVLAFALIGGGLMIAGLVPGGFGGLVFVAFFIAGVYILFSGSSEER